jgi:small subunit ribosomal protein S7
MTAKKEAVAEFASENSAKEKKVVSPAKKSEGKSEGKAKKFSNPFNMNDPMQKKLVQSIMKNGKKTIAQNILKDCFEEMHSRGEKDVLKTFESALSNTVPSMEVRPKRIGGSVYQIPIEVTPKRQISLPVRWILTGARNKKGQPMFKRLATELIDASNEQGYAFGKKDEVQRVAQANKAFAHLARY